MLNSLASLVVLWVLGGGTAKVEPGTQLAYRGSLTRVTKDGAPAQADKSFDLTVVVAEASAEQTLLYWVLDENGRGQWPWPERFGKWLLDATFAASPQTAPSLLYDRGEATAIVALASPFLTTPAPTENKNVNEIAWEQGDHKYQVQEATRLEGRDVWQVLVSNQYGRKRVVWVDPGGPLVVGVDERVFMGQGEEYLLEMRLAAVESLAADALASTTAGFESLTNLNARLGRPARTETPDFNEKQMQLLRAELPALEQTIHAGPLQRILAAAVRDVGLQTDRSTAVARLIAQFQGREVEKFQVDGLDQQSLSDAALRGRVTVLHFWDYRDVPLKEPYGQVGYLDFLYEHRKADGVQVYGVAVDARLAAEETRGAALRSINKLKSFMNLSYPVLLDNGTLLKKFGDPRLLGAPLPVFVVIGPDGKIAHYYVGCYEVDRDAGLKVLDQAVTAALRAKSS